MKYPQVTPYHIECLFRDYQDKLSEYEQKFLVSAISMINKKVNFSDRQLEYFDQLYDRLRMWQRLKS